MNTLGSETGNVKVSVQMITYNHEKYIAQAIEGVLMQETDFPYELVIGEDYSTDGTRDIVVEYARRHPDKIRALLPEKNLGMRENGRQTREACQGEYIALCEGDDYWTDPCKLQKQVDFLEAHPECSMCFHNVMVLREDQSSEPHSFCRPDQKAISTLEDLLIKNFIPTASVLYRSGLKLPQWYYEVAMDWPFFVLVAQRGDIGYLNEVMAVYRMHEGSVWWWQDPIAKFKITFPMFGHFYHHFGKAYEATVRTGASKAIAAGAAATYKVAETDSLTSSLDFVRTALATASAAGYATPSFNRVTKARSYEALGFAAYQKRNMRTACYCYACALALDPTIARNKGVLSLWFEACFGEKASAIRRSLGAHLRRARSLR